ncbi:unnamed protein product [Mucor hiemalis]
MIRSIARQSLINSLIKRSLSTRTLRLTPAWVNAVPTFPTQRRSLLISSAQWQQQYTITEMNTDRYHRLSDELLEHMCGKLEELADTTDMKGFDVEYNQGVMTISVGEHGTYVINKQPPNHQIWLSSPVSGPQRYDFDEQHHTWFYHRDNHTLQEVLNTELSAAFGYTIDLLEGFEPEEQ